MHTQVDKQDIERQVYHQDNFEDGLACIQAKEDNAQVKEQQRRETLKPSYLYLDSMSSFNQMFVEKHLNDVKEVGVTLCGKCNGGTVFSNKKGIHLNMLFMWLV